MESLTPIELIAILLAAALPMSIAIIAALFYLLRRANRKAKERQDNFSLTMRPEK
jgi:uncharacterized membrane protein SpoIIM required for sporulation